MQLALVPVRGRIHVLHAHVIPDDPAAGAAAPPPSRWLEAPAAAAFLALAEAWLWQMGAVLRSLYAGIGPFVDAILRPSAEEAGPGAEALPASCAVAVHRAGGWAQEFPAARLRGLLSEALPSRGQGRTQKQGQRYDVAHVRLISLPPELAGRGAPSGAPKAVTTPGLHCCCGAACVEVRHLEVVPREVRGVAAGGGVSASGWERQGHPWLQAHRRSSPAEVQGVTRPLHEMASSLLSGSSSAYEWFAELGRRLHGAPPGGDWTAFAAESR